ncbi:MAG: carboxypeptidase regulatory-like domain-containing protein, partial [Proteobacteria bacterium]
MKKLLGLCTLLCTSWALNASPFTEQQTLKLEHDIQLLQEAAVGQNNLSFSNYFLQNLKQKHRIFSQYFADADIPHEEKQQVKALYQSLNETLSLYLSDIHLLKFSEQTITRGNGQGVITGRIIDAQSQSPMENTYVYLYNGIGGYKGLTQTDNLGRYVFTQLSADDYYVKSGGNNLYVDQFYGDIICPGGIGQGCVLSELQPVSLTQGAVLEGVNINLTKSGIISGQLNLEETGDSSTVELYNENAELIATTTSNYSTNNYQFYIPPNYNDNLYLKYSSDKHFNKLYLDVPCEEGCSILSGTPINVSPYQRLNLENVQLQAYAGLSGQFSLNTLTDIGYQSGYITITDTNHVVISSTFVNLDFNDWTSSAVDSGQYFAYASVDGYIRQYYNLKNCYGEELADCPEVIPDLINHNKNIVTEQINFNLDQYGTISGSVKDRDNNNIWNPKIKAFDLDGELHGGGIYIDENNYTVWGLKDGQYYVTASYYGFLTSLYPGYVCIDSPYMGYCNDTPPANSILTVTQNNHLENRNITIYEGATILSQVLDDNQQPLRNKTIVLMDDQYNIIRQDSTTNTNGIVRLSHLTLGTYYLAVKESQQYKAGLYAGIHCETFDDCPLNLAAEINLSSYTEHGPYQISVNSKPALIFNLTSNKTNTPITEGTIKLYDTQGNKVYSESVSSSSIANLYPSAGQYYAVFEQAYASYNSELFVNKVYGGNNCSEQCNPLSGSLITIPNQGNVNVSMNLDAAFKISGTLSLEGSNTSYNYITVNLYRNNQLTASNYINGSYRSYHLGTEPIKMSAEKNKYYTQFYNNINCQGTDCGLNQATVIQPALNAEKIVDFNLKPLNSIRGRVTDSQNQPIDDFSVYLINTYGFVTSTSTDSMGHYSFNGLEADNYNVYTPSQIKYLPTRHTGSTCYQSCEFSANANIILGATDHITDIDITPVDKGGIQVNNLKFQDGRIASNFKIKVFDKQTDQHVISKQTNNDGNTDTMYLGAGDYYVIAGPRSNYSFVPQTAYPNINCRNMTETACGQASISISITGSAIIDLNDFILNDAGYITATLKDAVNQTVLSEAREFKVFNSNMVQVYSGNLTNNSKKSLLPGQYYIMASPYSQSQYTAQLYPDVLCPGGLGIDCVLSQGQTVNINDNQNTNTEFLMHKKPSITIHTVDDYSSQSVESIIQIYKVPDYSYHQSNLKSDHLIHLDPGQYYVWAKPNHNTYYKSTLYPNVKCDEYDFRDCNYYAAQLIDISPSGHVPITIGLELKRGFKGQMINGITQMPISNATIDFWRYYHPNYSVH